MTTLFEVRTTDGKLIGRCDVRCYAAQTTKCTCVCGGLNHAKGLRTAARNALDLVTFTDPDSGRKLIDDKIEVHKHHRLSYLAHPRLFDTE